MGFSKKNCSRRDFLKWSMALGGITALSAGALSLGLRPAFAIPGEDEEVLTWTGCGVNCGSHCPLRVFTKNGQIVRIETDNYGDGANTREIRACLRGRSMRQLTYSPDRIKYPMKRVGKRGEGKFIRISWDEALDTVAKELKRIIDTYGNEAVHRLYGSGTTNARINRRTEFFRLINLLGGQLDQYGSYSSAQISAIEPYIYGSSENNSISDMANSRLVVMFGSNIMETRLSGGGLSYELLLAKRKGNSRFIIIDPRYSDTMSMVGDQWVPIRPGTDAALASAIAYVLIKENMVDQSFLNKYCIGYDAETMPEGIPAGNSYKDYILGNGADKTPKTPEWAAKITGYPADGIIRLAREIGQAKPAFIIQGLGPQRQAGGEQNARAISMLAILTGNIGIAGGGTGLRERATVTNFPELPSGKNPVKTRIPCFLWYEAIKNGPAMTALNSGIRNKDKLDVGIKFMWVNASNTLLNQHSDINATKKILEDEKKCEMIVVVETRLTSSAMFADILLPSVTPPEQDEMFRQGWGMDIGSLVIGQKAIEPLFEAKTQYDICTGIAERFGIKDEYTEGRTQLDWVKYLYNASRKVKTDLPESFEEARKQGVFKWLPESDRIGFKKFREDPANNPLKTPSGKIEIFSERLWEIGKTWELPEGDVITAVAEYTPTWEGADDYAGKERFPLQLIGHHFKGRVHSSYADLPWLAQVSPQTLWMNTLDAAKRGIRHGDMVKVFNERGASKVQVKVTPRIMPGVVSLPQGAWHKAGAGGEDIGGCINVLTKLHPSPLAKGNPQHTNLVEVIRE